MNLNPVKSALTIRKLFFYYYFLPGVTEELQFEEELWLRYQETMGVGTVQTAAQRHTCVGKWEKEKPMSTAPVYRLEEEPLRSFLHVLKWLNTFLLLSDKTLHMAQLVEGKADFSRQNSAPRNKCLALTRTDSH